jgi:hypothetical protein
MANFRLTLKPGIDKQNTEYGAEGGWIDADFVRFRYGLPEKIGGWAPFNGTSTYLVGMISEIFTWTNLDGIDFMIVGTNKKLYVSSNGIWSDITPIRETVPNVTFDTVNGSTTVTVNDTAHSAIAGDFVSFSLVTGNPGGVANADLTNEFEIQSITNVNEYTILVPNAATSTVLAAGTATAAYQINIGSDVSYFGYGWGIGTWSAETWGTPRTATSEIELYSRVWQFDNYGEDVICQLVNGSTYLFDTSAGIYTRAAIVSGAPTRSLFALVSNPDRHLICFGTESIIGDSSSQDRLFVRFSDQENIQQFVESATNTAGGQRLTDGSRIITAIRSRGQILIFTDTALDSMQYLGPPYTFGFQQLGVNCGCTGPHAAVDVNGLAFWMGQEAFYVFDGTVKKLPCTVQDYVFKDINLVQSTKIHAGVNSQFNEVTWWYCSANSNFIDRCVSYNYLEDVWYNGSLSRTAWEDVNVYKNPLASDYLRTSTEPTISTIYGLTRGRSIIYAHEDGYNANGVPISSYIQSGYFDLGDGDNMMFMKRFIPDFKQQQEDLTVRLLLRAYPQASATTSSLDPYVITPTTQKVDTRARGRQISLRIESDALDGRWRYGTMRVDLQPDGLR